MNIATSTSITLANAVTSIPARSFDFGRRLSIFILRHRPWVIFSRRLSNTKITLVIKNDALLGYSRLHIIQRYESQTLCSSVSSVVKNKSTATEDTEKRRGKRASREAGWP